MDKAADLESCSEICLWLLTFGGLAADAGGIPTPSISKGWFVVFFVGV